MNRRKDDKETKVVTMACAYDHYPTFRRSLFTKKDWETICRKFGFPDKAETINYIRIAGEDDFGHILIDVAYD